MKKMQIKFNSCFFFTSTVGHKPDFVGEDQASPFELSFLLSLKLWEVYLLPSSYVSGLVSTSRGKPSIASLVPPIQWKRKCGLK